MLDVPIFLGLSSVVTCFIKRKAVSAHTVPGTGNMIRFVVNSKARVFSDFSKTARIGMIYQLMDLYMWFNHVPKAFKELETCADDYAPFE